MLITTLLFLVAEYTIINMNAYAYLPNPLQSDIIKDSLDVAGWLIYIECIARYETRGSILP
jgi:hypothetical protein